MWTQKDEIECLKSMLNSCFAYDLIRTREHVEDFRKSWSYERYVKPYESILGLQLFAEIYYPHMNNLVDNFTVARGVFTDGEGCTYNSIVLK